MKSRSLVLGLAACLVVGAGLLMFIQQPEKAVPAPGQPTVAKAVVTKEDAKNSNTTAPAKAEEDKDPVAPLDAKQRETLLVEIEQISVTYDAKELPKLEPYLLHPDAEVRKAAMNGMVVLGDSAASPLLRKAAEKAPTPQEAVALTEAADFMALPEGSFVPKDRAKQGTRKPLDGKPAPRPTR